MTTPNAIGFQIEAEVIPKEFIRGQTLEFVMELPPTVPADYFEKTVIDESSIECWVTFPGTEFQVPDADVNTAFAILNAGPTVDFADDHGGIENGAEAGYKLMTLSSESAQYSPEQADAVLALALKYNEVGAPNAVPDIVVDDPITFVVANTITSTVVTSQLRQVQNQGDAGFIADFTLSWDNPTTLRFKAEDTENWPLGLAEFDVKFVRTVTQGEKLTDVPEYTVLSTKKIRSSAVQFTIKDGITQ